MSTATHTEQIAAGERFEFGKNWSAFLTTINEERINEAIKSLQKMLNRSSLEGQSFLDVGSGSGLFSLAAKRLGASVHSLDYDPGSVACTRVLKSRFYDQDNNWMIEEGSALDSEYMRNLGTFDIVYSWGVLHHSGNMAKGLENIIFPVADNGCLYIAIYNDQKFVSTVWRYVKRMYCSGLSGQIAIKSIFFPLFTLAHIAVSIRRNGNPLSDFKEYKKRRGMSIYHDWIDWLGGYPFEVASPEAIEHKFHSAGFNLQRLVRKTGMGCNEYLFQRVSG